jgi:alpha-tubulin suppressor-like RCC1 family protein
VSVATTVSELSEVKSLSTKGGFTLALMNNGTVKAWGANGSGQLGSEKPSKSDVPVTVAGLEHVVAVAAGGNHSLALMENGTVKAWGGNAQGALGNGTTTASSEPATVEGLTEVVAIAAGEQTSFAVLKSGAVMAWGRNIYGELGNGEYSGPEICGYELGIYPVSCSTRPVEVKELTEVVAVSAGGEGTMALLGNGTVRTWGSNRYDQLGIGEHNGPETCIYYGVSEYCATKPVKVTELEGVTAVAAGGTDRVALRSGGTVWDWGDNRLGQLGTGGCCGLEPHPVKVKGVEGATAIAAGYYFSLALTGGGIVQGWGENGSGQLGNESHGGTDPVTALHLTEATAIAAGGESSLAIGPHGPSVAAVSPAVGSPSGGATVTIEGSHLGGATAVKFGSVAAPSFSGNAEGTDITATTPASKPGTVTVKVFSEHGVSASLSGDEYVFLPEGSIELGRCTKVGSGKGSYKTGTCIEALAGGSFKWTPGFASAGFTAGGEALTIETTGKEKLVCSASKGSGEYLGTREATLALTLTGCELAGAKCASTGAGEGEIRLSPLDGVLGYRERPTNRIGMELYPAGEAEALLEAHCGSSALVVRGAVIAAATPVNNMSSTFTLKFKQSKGKQSPEAFEGEPTAVLEVSIGGGLFVQAGLATEVGLANEEELEMNTVV